MSYFQNQKQYPESCSEGLEIRAVAEILPFADTSSKIAFTSPIFGELSENLSTCKYLEISCRDLIFKRPFSISFIT